jgi:hypothetical protein
MNELPIAIVTSAVPGPGLPHTYGFIFVCSMFDTYSIALEHFTTIPVLYVSYDP